MLLWVTRRAFEKRMKACFDQQRKAHEDAFQKNGWSWEAPNQLLSRALHSLNWTQTDLAERLGCDVSVVGDWLYARVETPKDVISWMSRLKKLADNGPLSQRAVDGTVVEAMEKAIKSAQLRFIGTTFETFEIPPPDYIRIKAEENFQTLLRQGNINASTFYRGSVRERAAFDFACQNLASRTDNPFTAGKEGAWRTL
jgi:transcriptional regulator with XRE-family HTH domain